MNERLYIKFKINPTEYFNEQINDLLCKNYFPRYKFRIRYLPKCSKYTQSAFGVNGEEKEVFKICVKSDLNYNYLDQDVHNTIMQQLDDEQSE